MVETDPDTNVFFELETETSMNPVRMNCIALKLDFIYQTCWKYSKNFLTSMEFDLEDNIRVCNKSYINTKCSKLIVIAKLCFSWQFMPWKLLITCTIQKHDTFNSTKNWICKISGKVLKLNILNNFTMQVRSFTQDM